MSLLASVKEATQRVYTDAMRRIRTDSFMNALTGLGTSRDKRTGARYQADCILQPQELDALFSSNDLACTIVSKIVDDALREGFEVKRRTPAGEQPGAPGSEALEQSEDPSSAFDAAEQGDADEFAALAEQILARCKELEAREKVHSGALWGRLFGGGGVILGVSGGGALETELKDESVSEVAFLIDVDRQDLIPLTWRGNGQVETFMWTPVMPSAAAGNIELGDGKSIVYGSPIRIHASRVILFPGSKTTNRSKARNQGWDHSVLQRIYNTLQGVDGMWASVEHMFGDMSQAVFKLQGFIASLAEAEGQGSQNVQTRIQLMDTLRSVCRAIVLDAGDETGAGAESFEVVERGALTGVDGILDKAFIRLACAARMPVTVLMGQSPAGMDATGESDLEIWYNEVQVFRRHVLEPRLERIVHLIAREVGDDDPTLWCIEWPPLEQADAKEEAEIDAARITAATALITAQVVQPEEVALSLDKIAPHLGLELDEEGLDARREALKLAFEQIRNPPDPMAGAVDPETGEPVEPAPGAPGKPVPGKPGQPAPGKPPPGGPVTAGA